MKEKEEGWGYFSAEGVGGEDLDGAEQEDKSPMASGAFVRCRSVSCSLTLDGRGEMDCNRNNQRD